MHLKKLFMFLRLTYVINIISIPYTYLLQQSINFNQNMIIVQLFMVLPLFYFISIELVIRGINSNSDFSRKLAIFLVVTYDQGIVYGTLWFSLINSMVFVLFIPHFLSVIISIKIISELIDQRLHLYLVTNNSGSPSVVFPEISQHDDLYPSDKLEG